MPLKNLKNLKILLQKAAAEKTLARRGVKVAAVIAEALRQVGEDPVLVGGAAVEFYTEGGYATKDIDMVAVGGEPLREVMKELGFEKRGKDFINKPLELYVEFPSECLNAFEKSDDLDVDGISLKIISIEDLIVDRLCAYKFWKSSADGLAALLLMQIGKEDTRRLKKQAKKKDVLDALEWIAKIYEEAFRKKMSQKEVTYLLATSFLKE